MVQVLRAERSPEPREGAVVLALDIGSIKTGWAIVTMPFQILKVGTIKLKGSAEEKVASARKSMVLEFGEYLPQISVVAYEEAPIRGNKTLGAKQLAVMNAFNLAIRWQAWDLVRAAVGQPEMVGIPVGDTKLASTLVEPSSLDDWFSTANLSPSKIANLSVVKSLVSLYSEDQAVLDKLSIKNKNGTASAGVDDCADAVLVAFTLSQSSKLDACREVVIKERGARRRARARKPRAPRKPKQPR